MNISTKLRSAPSFVYFVSNQLGFVKIGVTNNIKFRISEIQTGSAMPLKLIATIHDENRDCYQIESYIHGKLAKHRSCGEWFYEAAVLDFIKNGEVNINGKTYKIVLVTNIRNYQERQVANKVSRRIFSACRNVKRGNK